MVLMAVVGGVLVGGVALTLLWGEVRYVTWEPATGSDGSLYSGDTNAAAVQPVRTVARRYLRGVAIAVVGGFWAGALVTGPSVRLIMRLLAVTAGDDAQGRITEADEV